MDKIFEYSFLTAVVAYVYVVVLTLDKMILGWWYDFLTTHIKSEWILKPILLCEYCVGGQIAFWTYLIWKFHNYNPFEHIAFVCLSIFYILIFNKWLNLNT